MNILGFFILLAAVVVGSRQMKAELTGRTVTVNQSFRLWVLIALSIGFMAWEFADAFR